MRRSQECTVAQVSRAWPPAPPPGWPERVSQGCPTRAREVLLLAKERALHLHDTRLAYEMCHYLAEQPNKRNHAAVERIVTTVPRNATTYPRFIELEAWHTFIFLPAVKRAEAQKAAAAAAEKARGRKVYKRKLSQVEVRPDVKYVYNYPVYKAG